MGKIYGYEIKNYRGRMPTTRKGVEKRLWDIFQDNKAKIIESTARMAGANEATEERAWYHFKNQVMMSTAERYGGDAENSRQLLFSKGGKYIKEDANVMKAADRVLRSEFYTSKEEIASTNIKNYLTGGAGTHDLRNLSIASGKTITRDELRNMEFQWIDTGNDSFFYIAALGIKIRKRQKYNRGREAAFEIEVL